MALIRGALIALMLAQPAHALSCLRPDVVRSYVDRAGDPDLVVLLGSFNFPAGVLSQTQHDMTREPTEITIVAQFRGEDLVTGTRIETDLVIRGRCFGPWCGDMAPGTQLAFAQKTANGLELAVDPCGTAAFPNPDIETLARLERCMRDRSCEISD